MYPDRPRLQVLIGSHDVSERCDSLTFSATDQGGYEIATMGLPAADRPKKGKSVVVRAGLETAWAGRITELADHSQHQRATKTTGCEGLRALLRDTLVQMVYVDRDLTAWGNISNSRQIALLNLGRNVQNGQVQPDPTNGANSITQTLQAPWASVANCDSFYDAGQGNLIGAAYYEFVANANINLADANWTWTAYVATDAAMTQDLATSGNLRAASGSGAFYPMVPGRYALLELQYTAAVAGSTQYQMYWRNLAVYGTHGLPYRGPSPGGFYPSDIAQHALSQCANVSAGQIINAIGYIVPHLVYRTPTPADQIIDDMAKLMGWTWGVWEPTTILGSQPRLDFRPPPTDATCVVTKAECDQLDITSRIGDLYDICQVTYTDTTGIQSTTSVKLPNPQLYETGIRHRTLFLNMGPGSQAAAQSFGSFALALSQVASRGAGSATLPASVRLIGGGSKPACLLRPGLDRLRIVDMVDGGPLLDTGTVRRDVFRISRVETTVGPDGIPVTRAELDSGSNLLETLQARLAIAAGVVGSGASGG